MGVFPTASTIERYTLNIQGHVALDVEVAHLEYYP